MVGTESTGHMRLVASIVDDKMREISVLNPTLDSGKLAVLTAVNTVNEMLKLREEVESLMVGIRRGFVVEAIHLASFFIALL
ncbi:hypothetical protein RhiirA1_486342, partial [Rhizophagus irregularis]